MLVLLVPSALLAQMQSIRRGGGTSGPTTLSTGDAQWVDMSTPSQTNAVSGAVTISCATNGVAGTELAHVRWFFNGSGSDQTLTLPATWRTNFFSAVPSKLTNGITTVMYVKSTGSTTATQTNVFVSFEFYK